MNRQDVIQVLPSIVVIVAIVVLWQVLVPLFHIPEFELPTPSRIFDSLFVTNFDWPSNSLVTLYETLAGFGMAVLVGIPISIGIVYSTWFNRTIYPLILVLQLIPKVGVAPLLFLIFGFGIFPRILVTFLLAFFPIILNTTSGLGSLDPDYVDLMRSLGSSKLQIFAMARFPNALPYIFDGLKIGVTFALIGAVVAEFVQSNAGLGYLLLNALSVVGTSSAFAALLLLTIIGAGLFLVLVIGERFAVAWYIRSKQARG